MKIKNITLAMFAFAGIFAFTSCGNSGEELSKKISEDEISITGKHADLLEITDSAKLMLTNPSGEKDDWQVQMTIPMSNTSYWRHVPGTDKSNPRYYLPQMGNIKITFLTSDGAELDYEASLDYDVIGSMLSSETTSEQNVPVRKSWRNHDHLKYKEAKALYDKVAGARISNADLTEGYNTSSSSSSSSYSSDDDDLDLDDLDDAIEASKKAMKAASKAAKAANSKDVKEAMDAYNDALDAYSNMLK